MRWTLIDLKDFNYNFKIQCFNNQFTLELVSLTCNINLLVKLW